MFEVEQLILDCRAALAGNEPQEHVREIVARAVCRPAALLDALGEPQRAGLHELYRSSELTIVNVVWAPMMAIPPHDHAMWAVIGVYTGREDNIFWRRIPGDPGKVQAAGARTLCEGDTQSLGRSVIHSVTNPIVRLTAAIHVYGGDFFNPDGRSEWNAETLREGPFDLARAQRRFEEAKALYRPMNTARG
jgi:predicted metal-dependent enzyme (double-stranded beta helix superfamily)